MTGNVRTKTVLVLIGTLVLGMVLGALLTGVLVRHRIHHLRQLRTPAGFTQEMMQAIEPTGPDQRESLRKALKSHVQRMREVRERYRNELRAEVDSMHAAAEKLLTPKQQERMREKMKELHKEGEHAQREFSPFGARRLPSRGPSAQRLGTFPQQFHSGME